MPKPSKKSSKIHQSTDKSNGSTFDSPDLSDDSLSFSQPENGMVPSGKKMSKRKEDLNEPMDNFGNEMQRMLECFGADVAQTVTTKRKRIDAVIQGVFKSTIGKIDDAMSKMQSKRQKVHDEFKRQMAAILQQYDKDDKIAEDEEEKLLTMLKLQVKRGQQNRIEQKQRATIIRQIFETYSKGLEDLKGLEQSESATLREEIKKEAQLTKKKMLMELQNHEMASVRSSLQNVLFQSLK